MHLIISIGAVVTGIGLCIGVLGGHPLWQWLTHRQSSSLVETNPWMFDDFDQDDDEPPPSGDKSTRRVDP